MVAEKSSNEKEKWHHDYKAIHYSAADDIGYLTLNRPNALNAMNGAMIEELEDLFRRLMTDEKTRVIVLAGAGFSLAMASEVGLITPQTRFSATHINPARSGCPHQAKGIACPGPFNLDSH